jgi:hypothetical protein
MYKNYQKTRFSPQKSRKGIWEEVTRYLERYIPKDSAVLDLGAGYCDFINSVRADKRYALDKHINPREYASEGVIALFGGVELLERQIADRSLDVVMASNFLEHLENKELEGYLSAVRSKLKTGGLLLVIQPNFRLCYRNYFDDYTHVRAWSDISLADYLITKGFSIICCKPRFIPFSIKSRLPKARPLIWLYLRSPIKPFAGQMLIIAKKA